MNEKAKEVLKEERPRKTKDERLEEALEKLRNALEGEKPEERLGKALEDEKPEEAKKKLGRSKNKRLEEAKKKLKPSDDSRVGVDLVVGIKCRGCRRSQLLTRLRSSRGLRSVFFVNCRVRLRTRL